VAAVAVEKTSTEPTQTRLRERRSLALSSTQIGAPNEQERWARFLGIEIAALSVCLAALFASGIVWFVLPTLAVPIGGALTLVYLAMSSDTNVEST
jgi:hypothetical protein